MVLCSRGYYFTLRKSYTHAAATKRRPWRRSPVISPVEVLARIFLRSFDGLLFLPRALSLCTSTRDAFHIWSSGTVLIWSVLRCVFWLGTMLGPANVDSSDSDVFFVCWTVGLYWVPFAMQYTSTRCLVSSWAKYAGRIGLRWAQVLCLLFCDKSVSRIHSGVGDAVCFDRDSPPRQRRQPCNPIIPTPSLPPPKRLPRSPRYPKTY